MQFMIHGIGCTTARLTDSGDVKHALCTGSGSIQSLCRPPMAVRNTQELLYNALR